MDSVRDVIEEGLGRVRRRYPESSGRYYHSILHTQMVMKYARLIVNYGFGKSPSIFNLFDIAAAWHDAEQSLGPGLNEDESARLAEISMTKHGFAPHDIEVVKNLIKATKVSWSNGVMHQEAEKMGLWEKIMADADLCAIGADTEEFVEMAQRLMAELAKKPFVEMTAEEKIAGWTNQVKFMTGRNFLTSEASYVMGMQLVDNLVLAKRYASGEIK